MHVIILILTIFFADGKRAPEVQFVQAPSLAACQAVAPKLEANTLAEDGVRDAQVKCVDVERKDHA